METFGLYLLKSTVWLTAFALIYTLFLRNERYFRLNRIFLLAGLVASLMFPLLTLHYTVNAPVSTNAVIDTNAITVTLADSETHTTLPFYWWVYFGGILLFAIRLIIQTLSIVHKLGRSAKDQRGSLQLVRCADYSAPFSFFSYVFIHPSTCEPELGEILNHEREHVEQAHWFDLLVIELITLMHWCNPFAWLYGKFIRQNHEFLADEQALQKTSDVGIYRATLLNQLLGGQAILLANSFNYSLNKKRFTMMKNIPQSPIRKLRLLAVMPLVAALFAFFAEPQYATNLQNTSQPAMGSTERMVKQEKVKEATTTKKQESDKATTKEKQSYTVNGMVVDQDGKPISGATIILKGSTTGTITDASGKFALKNIPQNAILSVSYVGYITQNVKTNSSKPFQVILPKDSKMLDKITVVGYAPFSTKSSSGSSSGTPSIIKADALFLVDGKEVTKEEMNAIDPKLIQSLSVLKDASATALYGERGAKGVILVTLKTAEQLEKEKKEAEAKAAQKGAEDQQSPAQSTQKKEGVFVVVEQMPEFPGGNMEMMKFIQRNMRYPSKALEQKQQGNVVANFIVDRSGKIKDARILRSVSKELDNEALRVIQMMPDWKPGRQKGEAVDVSYTIPIQFAIQGGK